MPRLRSRAVVAAVGAGLVLPALATLPSQAVVGSGTVSSSTSTETTQSFMFAFVMPGSATMTGEERVTWSPL